MCRLCARTHCTHSHGTYYCTVSPCITSSRVRSVNYIFSATEIERHAYINTYINVAYYARAHNFNELNSCAIQIAYMMLLTNIVRSNPITILLSSWLPSRVSWWRRSNRKRLDLIYHIPTSGVKSWFDITSIDQDWPSRIHGCVKRRSSSVEF